jgi:hypothetical protein
MASSIKALSSSLRKVAKRLEAMRDGRPLEKNVEFFDDLDDEDVTAPPMKTIRLRSQARSKRSYSGCRTSSSGRVIAKG